MIPLQTFRTITRKLILQKILFYDFRLIECSFRSIEHELNSDRFIQRLQDYFLTISIDWAKARSKMNFEFSLRKFQNLNFHFIKQYFSNSNIILTTYPCIYIYIQHVFYNFNLCYPKGIVESDGELGTLYSTKILRRLWAFNLCQNVRM